MNNELKSYEYNLHILVYLCFALNLSQANPNTQKTIKKVIRNESAIIL